MILHAGLIAAHRRGRWQGVLIEGPSGAGKSDLALRALDQGFRLVADDRVVVWASAGRLFGRAPAALAGLIEVRGLDVVTTSALGLAEIMLVMRCGTFDRIPERHATLIEGVSIPVLALDPNAPSAPAKLSRALDLFDEGSKRRI